jgi:hypothetical protein
MPCLRREAEGMTITAPVWCASCKVAWVQSIVEQFSAPITQAASPVRCPRCTCHRRVRRIPEEVQFSRDHPEVTWIR